MTQIWREAERRPRRARNKRRANALAKFDGLKRFALP
jgi:hypothetical protein